MEVQGTESTQEVGSSTDAAAVSSSSQPEITSNAGAPSGEVTEAPAYTPTYKFKVMDKELEFDDFIRPVVTKDNEAKIKELYEKAYGIDEVKKLRDQIRDEYKSYKGNTDPVMDMVNKATKAYHAKDLDTTFEILGIPKKQVLQYALKQIQYEELDPQQKAQYDQQREQQRNYYSTQEQLEQVTQNYQQSLAQQRLWELDQALSKPEIAQIAQSFDQRNGPGSFKNEIILQGQAKWNIYKQDVPPAAIIEEMTKKYGFQSQMAQPQANSQQVVQNVPTIPVIKGSGSPAVRNVTSVDDMKKLYKEKFS